MNLDDFAKENQKLEEEEEDAYEDSTEADLSNALSLLEDCYSVFDDIMKAKDSRGKLSLYLYNRIEELQGDIIALTSQYDDVPEKGEIDIFDVDFSEV